MANVATESVRWKWNIQQTTEANCQQNSRQRGVETTVYSPAGFQESGGVKGNCQVEQVPGLDLLGVSGANYRAVRAPGN